MKNKILSIFRTHPDKLYRKKDLLHHLKISEKNILDFKKHLDTLVKSGEVVMMKGKRYKLAKDPDTYMGKLTVTQKGFGFVIVGDGRPDIFIGRRQMGDAIHGDTVSVKLSGRQRSAGPRGRILNIVERGTRQFIGVSTEIRGKLWLTLTPVTPERGVRLHGKDGIKPLPGEIVIARIKEWGKSNTPIRAQFIESLGQADEALNDLRLILAKYEYRTQFNTKVRREVENMDDRMIEKAIPRRRDLRNLTAVTIDPEDAKDFDDAISIEQVRDGFQLGVHIADVSHFVLRGTALDKTAMERGTSVYFSEGVVHMLPEALSSDLCSLRPGVDRLTVSCVMKLNRKFEVQKTEIFPSVIKSKKRFTYREVQSIIEGEITHALYKPLKLLERLSIALFKSRSKEGSIDFDIPEPIFSMDDTGIPHEIRPSERLRAHRIVEECMLLANRQVAQELPKKLPKNFKIPYRIHDKPDQKDVNQFLGLIRRLNLGISVPKGELSPSAFKQILAKVEDSPFKHLIEAVALRTMSKAVYSTKNHGHFGLAFPHYVHFTSPIRRYPDLMVHRLIKRINSQSFEGANEWNAVTKKALTLSNEMELQALSAEREYIKMKQLRWLNTAIGESFKGIISGVVNFGIFVELEETLAEGLVHIDTLEGDDYSFDEEHYCLRGRQYKEEYRLGDRVNVRVLSVLFDKQRANFVLDN